MEKRPQRKMVNIDVQEVSAVDHPAHLTEGWVVMKAANSESVDALFGTPAAKEVNPVPENTPVIKQEDYDALVAKAAKLEAENAELVAKAAEVVKPAETEDLSKSADLPEAVKELLAKQAGEVEEMRKQAALDREAVQKERDARLDSEAIHASESLFKSVAIDHKLVAPALRRLEAFAPEVAKSVGEALKAADAQLESAGIFAELGKSAGATELTAVQRIQAAGEELRKAAPTMTPEEAFTKALELSPELQAAYLKGE